VPGTPVGPNEPAFRVKHSAHLGIEVSLVQRALSNEVRERTSREAALILERFPGLNLIRALLVEFLKLSIQFVAAHVRLEEALERRVSFLSAL
jgi:hypothetical protein